MEINEIINRIESIIKSEDQKSSPKVDEQQSEESNGVKDIFILLLNFLLSIIKGPFNLIAKYLKNEIINTIKKDTKLYALIMGIMGVMFVFFSVLWLFISVAIGVYYFENGNSILTSILYSIIFQVISFTFVGLVAFVASTQIKSLKMLKKI
jgi:hypothetical protein